MTAADQPAGTCPGGLRYVSEAEPGITRRRAGRGFVYRDQDTAPVRDAAVLDRIRRLAIPPAWTDVWICADPCGHLQATGRDAKGRRQYRYHEQWREEREAEKYGRLATFGRALPAIRRQVDRDLGQRGITRDKVLAAVVRLLDTTSLRVGNESYARENGSFGLTTLRNHHVVVEGSRLRFRFRGKAGKEIEAGVRDARLARVIARCQDLPGQELFEYMDADGTPRRIGSADVNEYLREAARIPVTAKDFRTWAGTLLAYRALRAAEAQAGLPPRASRRLVVESTRVVAEALHNTPAVSRRSYIAPTVVDAFLSGALATWRRAGGGRRRAAPGTRAEELELVALLETEAATAAPSGGSA